MRRTDLVEKRPVPEPEDPVAGGHEHGVDLDVPVRTHRPLEGRVRQQGPLLLEPQNAVHYVDLWGQGQITSHYSKRTTKGEPLKDCLLVWTAMI